jgi:hypothetical protein
MNHEGTKNTKEERKKKEERKTIGNIGQQLTKDK